MPREWTNTSRASFSELFRARVKSAHQRPTGPMGAGGADPSPAYHHHPPRTATYQRFDNTFNGTWNSYRSPPERSYRFPFRETESDLERRIRRKVSELVNEEETLVDLYVSAAQMARERESEVRKEMTRMISRIKKDRKLLQILKEMK